MKPKQNSKNAGNKSSKLIDKKTIELKRGISKSSHKPQQQKQSKAPRLLKFTSANSLEELKKTEKHIRKMSFADRLKLELEAHDGSSVQKSTGFGQRQISYTVKDHSDERLHKLREKQEIHKKERRKLARNTDKLSGKEKSHKANAWSL